MTTKYTCIPHKDQHQFPKHSATCVCGDKTRKMKKTTLISYAERHERFPGKVIISYNMRWGGYIADRKLWLAELNGEVWDYNHKAALIEDALAEGYGVVVLRVHKTGTVSVMYETE